MTEKTASITDDRLNDGTKAFWIDLGTIEDGISDQKQAMTLKEAKKICKDWVGKNSLILHFARGGMELETTYET